MSDKLGYADAVKLLGGADKRIVSALDGLTGGLLLAATGGGASFVMSLLDVRGELARLNQELVSSLGNQIRGLGRFDRTQRLAAAHRVIVLTGFFEAVSGTALPFDPRMLRLDKPAQVGISTGEDVPSQRLGVLASILNDSDVPGEYARPGTDTGPGLLEGFYARLSGRLLAYVEGLAAWEHASPGAREAFAGALRDRVPGVAVRRYEEHLRQLASDFPEVAFWVSRLDHATTHEQLQALRTGLAGLGQVLDQIASGGPPDDRRRALARRYHKSLGRPIVATGDVPEGMTIPSLVAAYLSPRYRAAAATRAARLDQEPWWQEHPVRDDLEAFLIGHLTSVTATEAPLIVLGQPGSGKSVLTRVIAARLPARDYLAVRVELREVPADTDLQAQIEYAIRDATGETMSWPALARSAGGALPVVLLDGFDELLQATGIGQTDYLEQIARFQEREADHGRPVAVIVTSRTAVADRARIPAGGAVAVRLEPFTDEQIRRWLAIWNASNASYLTRRRLLPLSADVVLRQQQLARQPLLLLMLALHDADDNALQQHAAGLGEADLYERILTGFAEREVRKSLPGIAAEPLRAAVEQDLLRLSVAAFAMFNRSRQWVTEDELSADLTALLGAADTHQAATSFRAASTPAQLVVGRFFFIHQAQAMRGGTVLTTCEFLHATFGEFLSARLIVRELGDLAAVATTRSRQAAENSFLRVLLSFAPLTLRSTIPDFLTTLTRQLSGNARQLLRGLLLTAFHGALEPSSDAGYDRYGPGHVSAPARHAAYSANLLLLIVLIGGPVTGRELFPDRRFPAADWRRHAMLWRSQFTAEGWKNLAAALRLQRIWHAGDREICVSLEQWQPPGIDSFWTFRIPPGDEMRKGYGWRHILIEDIRKESYFTCDTVDDIIWHGIEPLAFDLDLRGGNDQRDVEATTAFFAISEEQAVSVTHAMIRLWLTSSHPADAGELQQAYKNCLTVIEGSRPENDAASRNDYLARVLRQLAADRERLPGEFREELLSRFKESILQEAYLKDHPILRDWAAQAFSDPGSGPSHVSGPGA
jgi:CheY-like chemotaxis protein